MLVEDGGSRSAYSLWPRKASRLGIALFLSCLLCFLLFHVFYGFSIPGRPSYSRGAETGGSFHEEMTALRGVVAKLDAMPLMMEKHLAEQKMKEENVVRLGKAVANSEFKNVEGKLNEAVELEKAALLAIQNLAMISKQQLGATAKAGDEIKAVDSTPPLADKGSYSLASRESFGFYNKINESDWRLRTQKVWTQRGRQENIATHGREAGNAWFQDHWEPEWACELEERVGIMGDGGKWVCDLPRISEGDCLVYSIGSSNEWSFEEDFYNRRQCEIFTFDHTSRQSNRPAFVHFHPWGLGPPPAIGEKPNEAKDGKVIDMNGLIEQMGHSERVIDVLKIDIEGAEFETLTTLLEQSGKSRKQDTDAEKEEEVEKAKDGGKENSNMDDEEGTNNVKVLDRRQWRRLPVIRQVLIEIHIGVGGGTAAKSQRLLRAFADNGYVIFHKEPNIKYGGGVCTEFALLLLNLPAAPSRL
eukprot:GHVS01039979.1.p1 GENE.GHVS01039979.1~~GHVS01039979.1.p1  ORF type:complete len:472 (+),score=76.65 GHVS01039979.1:45-1460(+)